MSGIIQGAGGMGGNTGDLDGQNFGVGMASKDQRANKEALLKMTRNKRQTGAGAATSKTPGGGQQTK
jgi:hypothetical protein